MKKYEQYTADDRVEATLFDNDVHYLNGELDHDNIARAIKWIISANIHKKPKRKLTLYVNTVGGDKMHDMKAQMKENNNCELRCMQILRDATGYSLSDVRKKFNNPSDQYFTAKQLVDLKVADHIL